MRATQRSDSFPVSIALAVCTDTRKVLREPPGATGTRCFEDNGDTLFDATSAENRLTNRVKLSEMKFGCYETIFNDELEVWFSEVWFYIWI